ncbi:MAG: lipid-A-disaccharide synthase [Candidatus Eisenbacteria bacterium]|nr:lipid-A-disaccharide synthase [Candidatus Eisenbacteria bacterium]
MGGALSVPGAREARRLLIVAGEASGDHHAANLLRALGAPGRFEARGVAGPQLRAAGAQAIVRQEELAVIGFSGILAKLPALLGARARLLGECARWRPDAAVLVDYPGFNLRLGPQLRARGVPVFYYVAPQVWAWHPERAAQMAAWVNRLAVVFPFEEPLFREAGVPTTFVGHPLLDDLAPEVDADTLRRELGAPPHARLVGLLPGSRAGEIAQHAATLVEAGLRVRQRHADAFPVVALADGASLDVLPAALRGALPAVRGRTRAVQAHAACCAVASGTATLETALFGTPLLVVYRVGWLNWQIARRLVTLPHIGLPNIVAGASVAPELLQDAFTPGAVAEVLGGWLADPRALGARRAALAGLRDRLGGPGASARAAAALAEMLA